jgi:D-mannonate dehydratase
MPINWTVEHFSKLRDAIDAKGITIEQAIDAINKVGVEKSCWTCTHYIGSPIALKCQNCNNLSKYEVKNV